MDPQRAAVAGKRARLELDESLTDGEADDLVATQPHDPIWSGDLIFCRVCGAYAETKTVKLKGDCGGNQSLTAATAGLGGSTRSWSFGEFILVRMKTCHIRYGSMVRFGSRELVLILT